MYHMLNHSLNKSLMFFGSGVVIEAFHTKIMDGVHGVLQRLPYVGPLWLIGAVAILGAPPGGLFLSELMILRGGLASSNIWAVFVMLVLLVVIFAHFLFHFLKMYEPDPNPGMAVKRSIWLELPMVFALIPLLAFGFWWPAEFWEFFLKTLHQLEGT